MSTQNQPAISDELLTVANTIIGTVADAEFHRYIPMEAKYVESSFEGLDENLITAIKGAYATGGSATSGSAGLDLRYVGKEALTLKPGQQQLVHTGLAIHIRNYELVGLIAPRSGLGTKGVVLGNLIGVIDSDYQGELLLTLWNRHEEETGIEITIEPGERVAQYFVVHRYHIGLNFVEEFGQTTARGDGGFGHSGRF
jgi:dUTP pyrophosphatase